MTHVVTLQAMYLRNQVVICGNYPHSHPLGTFSATFSCNSISMPSLFENWKGKLLFSLRNQSLKLWTRSDLRSTHCWFISGWIGFQPFLIETIGIFSIPTTVWIQFSTRSGGWCEFWKGGKCINWPPIVRGAAVFVVLNNRCDRDTRVVSDINHGVGKSITLQCLFALVVH